MHAECTGMPFSYVVFIVIVHQKESCIKNGKDKISTKGHGANQDLAEPIANPHPFLSRLPLQIFWFAVTFDFAE